MIYDPNNPEHREARREEHNQEVARAQRRHKPSRRAQKMVERLLRTYGDFQRYRPTGLMPFGMSARPWAAVEDSRRVLVRYVATLGGSAEIDRVNELFASLREEGTDLNEIERQYLALLSRLERRQGEVAPPPF